MISLFWRVKYYSSPIRVESMFINSEDELLREFIYKAFLKKNPQQEIYFKEIVQKRFVCVSFFFLIGMVDLFHFFFKWFLFSLENSWPICADSNRSLIDPT